MSDADTLAQTRHDRRELRHEARIVWLRPLETLPRYVREDVWAVPRRVGISRRRHPAVVGYAELRPEARSIYPGTFQRRVFWLAAHDPYTPAPGAPCEAVDPLTVAPGVPGRLTDRAIGAERTGAP
jgi:hypothetical protein